MKKLEWINPNRARIETGHRTFDRFCRFITSGNVVADGQMGNYIRPFCETECNGRKFAPGALRDFDIKSFQGPAAPPPRVVEMVKKATESKPAILYVFYHYTGDRIMVHGYILTRGSSGKNKLLWKHRTGPTRKSDDVLTWCADVIANR